MIRVLISYLKFHYGVAYVEGYKMLRGHGLALLFVGIPLSIMWALLPVAIILLFTGGLFLAFIWNVI